MSWIYSLGHLEMPEHVVVMDDDMYSIYLRGKVYVHLCTVQIGVRLSTWYVRYNTPLQLYAIV